MPATPGKTAVEMFEAVQRGEIKAVWIACTNPAQSLPDQNQVHAALQTAEYVVLQEAYADTETALYADVLLPAVHLGRNRWHDDQFRTLHHARACRRGVAGRGACRLGDRYGISRGG